ncbi:SusC/RagA family TonB-linked outer membrane protein [Algibacter mikhailovii]|uniref:SusC/RagA family TonB-linked outer membrane protein n=1 Tax=Algibacter mikhailovii TaxID=425498 RepID=UPI0024941480|nr:TonB-dependent receptor [Algibacter mikhailovii]
MKFINELRAQGLLKKVSCMTLLFLFCINFGANAQQISVKGTVKSSDDNLPIPGVAILVKGTSNGAVTDFDGNYSIGASIGDQLEFSYLGMETTTVIVSKSQMDVLMNTNLEDLDEVVVVGYGTQKKKEITGAVSQVKADQIDQFVTPDLANALQGQIAGVNVTANSGEPGEQSSIQIRGITSLSGSNTPLFVVDGIPQEGDPRLASNEIETIDVLKDAASAAVYGTRGAAGVILITTKRGKEGQISVDFNTTYGVQRLENTVPLMNTEQQIYFETEAVNYRELTNRSSRTIVTAGPNRPEWLVNDNDFTEMVLVNDAETKSYNLNLSGGTKSFSYNVVGGYFDQDGVLIGSGFKRYNGRATTTYKSDNWNIVGSIGFVSEDRRRASVGLITNAVRYKPYFPELEPGQDVFFTNGNGGVETPLNALAQNFKQKDRQQTDKIIASLSVTRDLAKGLSFTSRVGTNINSSIRNIFRPRFELVDIEDGTSEVDPLKSGVEARASRLSVFSWDNSLNYKFKTNGHNFAFLASAAIDERNYQEFLASRNGVVSNEIEVLNIGSQDERAVSGVNYVRKNVGFLGRMQYNYKGKYLLSALVRRDGSSKFGRDFRWGTFPSISLGWNVSGENFWKPLKPTINNFKIRLSHGTVGNDSFADYTFASTIAGGRDYIFDPTDSSFALGSAVIAYANPVVKWETSVSNNIGVDLGFWKNKLTLTADYYQDDKSDMLFPLRLPGSTGVVATSGGVNRPLSTTVVTNIGDMTNKGLELAANYWANIGASKLNIGATFTKNSNEITKIVDGVEVINNTNSGVLGRPTTVFRVGYEAGAYFLHQTNGVIKTQEELDAYAQLNTGETPEFGDLMYTDQITEDTDGDGIADAGDGIIDDNDRVYSGSGLPDYEIGFNLSWTYRNWDMGMNWYASVGSEIINATKADAFAKARHADLYNMWTPSNPTSNIPFYLDRDGEHPNYNGDTDLWLEDGSYLRLKLITLGYSLPSDVLDNIGLTKLRFYLSAQNALTITGYDGYDPEIGGNVTRRGIDSARYPISALYSFGLNLSF